MNKKITELTEATEINSEDLLMVIQNGENKKAQAGIIIDKVNENADEIDRLNEKNIITVGLSSNTELTIDTAWVHKEVLLNTVRFQKGDALTFENNAITINKDGIYEISANLMAQTDGDNSQDRILQIKHNSTVVAAAYTGNSTSGFLAVSTSPAYINAKAGDTICMVFGSATPKSYVIAGGAHTYLSVKEIMATNTVEEYDGISPISEKNILTVGSSSGFEITSTADYQSFELSLSSEFSRVGELLKIEEGKIVIPAGVSKILVSAQCTSNGNLCTYGMLIKKNNIETYQAYTVPSNQSFNCLSISPAIIDVAEGDLISLNYYINNSGYTRTVLSGYRTYLTVEVIR